MFDLPYIAARVFGVPLLMSKPRLDTMLATLGPRLVLGTPLPAAPAADAPPKPQAQASRYATRYTAGGNPVTEKGVAIVPVLGTLVRRTAFLDPCTAATGYPEVLEAVTDAMTDPEVRAVLLEVDSHGGEAGGVFDLADGLRELRKATGKPLWSLANENALSAGYAIGSAADRVWVTRTGEVGSIGVVAAHVDQSAADAKAGVAVTYIYAGAHKVDGHPHGPLSAEVLADIRADIGGLYSMFTDQVARNRGMSVEAVQGTEARIYRGTDAVDAGLADAVGTMADALSALHSELARPAGPTGRAHRATGGAKPATLTNSDKGTSPMADATVQDAADDKNAADTNTDTNPGTGGNAPATPDTPADPVAAAVAAANARAAEIFDIAAQASRMGVTVDAAAAIKNGTAPAALRKQVLDKAAEAATANTTVSARAIPDTDANAKAAANSGWDAAFGTNAK